MIVLRPLLLQFTVHSLYHLLFISATNEKTNYKCKIDNIVQINNSKTQHKNCSSEDYRLKYLNNNTIIINNTIILSTTYQSHIFLKYGYSPLSNTFFQHEMTFSGYLKCDRFLPNLFGQKGPMREQLFPFTTKQLVKL